MKKGFIILLSLTVFTTMYAKVLKLEKQKPFTASKLFDIEKIKEPESLGNNYSPGLIRNNLLRSSQNPNLNAVLVDSSVHGYGMVSTATNPLSYVDGIGFVIGYRGWVYEPYTDEQGNESSANNSGYVKAASSQDGWSFDVASGLNDQIMIPDGSGTTTADGPLMGRYPSSVANSDYPYVVWTEAINYTGSATNNGGRPMYTYDEMGWFNNGYSSPAFDINYGWSDGNEPLDAAGDLWVNCPVLVDDGTNKHMVVSANQWSSSPNQNFPEYSNYIMRNSDYFFGAYIFSLNPEILFDINELYLPGYNSSPTIDINSSGVGYAVASSYLDSTGINAMHSLIVRETNDYGATWSTDGFDDNDFYFIPDTTNYRLFIESEIIPDTVRFYALTDTTSGDSTWQDTTWTDTVAFLGAFIGYKNEARVDENGRLHVIADGLAQGDDGGIYYLGGALYHLWTDDPSNPASWNASRIVDLSDVMFLPPMPGQAGESLWQIVSGNIAISNQDPNTLWVGYHSIGDTSAANYNWDIFVTKSVDGGVTWSEPENVTMTGDLQEDELYVHLAPTATDTNCFMVYHQPRYNAQYSSAHPVNWLDDNSDIAAFQQNLWFATYGNPLPTVRINDEVHLPGQFSLDQNFPNPFNPKTKIMYSVERSGDVELSLYNVLGQKVKSLLNESKEPGVYEFVLNGNDLASGIYFYKMTQHEQTLTRKLVLMK